MSDTAIATRQPSSLARRDELTIEDMLAQVEKIQMVMARVMKEGEHFGVIPGTGSKPSLLKAGAEKLCLLFRLDPQYAARETVEGKHLTIESTCTLYHITTGERWGSGMGSCSTKESKYAYRKGKRVCPKCGADAINKSKFPPRGKPDAALGFYCYAKVGGCGVEFAADDTSITGQDTGRVANEDLADQYNTVLKMANKRALVAAVLNVTAASDIFTQDLEDLRENAHHDEPKPVQATEVKKPETADEEASRLFPVATPEEEERNSLIADAMALAKKLKLTPVDRAAFKTEYLGGVDPDKADVAALASMVAELRKRAGA